MAFSVLITIKNCLLSFHLDKNLKVVLLVVTERFLSYTNIIRCLKKQVLWCSGCEGQSSAVTERAG